MKTYLRYSLYVGTMEYPFKAPEYVQKEAQELKEICSKFEIPNSNGMLLIPIESAEYSMIMKFREKYKVYAYKNIIYEHIYTKKEMDEAEFYKLTCASLIDSSYNSVEIYKNCCENSKFSKTQIGNYKIKKSSMKKRQMAFSYDCRFFISNNAKQMLEEKKITNIEYLPIYDTHGEEVLAYQIETTNNMLPLAEANGWSVCYQCENCQQKYWNTIHEVPHPLYIPLEYKNKLHDFNSTEELFTEVGSRYYVISKRMYNLLKDAGTKHLKCEPIIFV